MTFRVLTTPIAPPPGAPAQRTGGVDPAITDGFLRRPGLESQLARLADPRVLVVTTGQQPALFTGPVYTVYKALSAAALARALEVRWERPVVPVFWIAGDDHDWTEARSASWLGADDTLVTGQLRDRPASAPMAPLAREPLGPEVSDALALLDRTLAGLPERDRTLAWLAPHFRPEETVAAAAAAALADLLAPFGIVCFDSTAAPVKRAGARHLVKALGLAADLDRDLGRRATELAGEGHDPGVLVGDGATLVMLDGERGRDRLVLGDRAFQTRRGGERFTLDQLQAIAAETPQRLSANVLLRPVLESALLPTVAYCAGPGELRYLPLAAPLFERLRVHRPAPVPRWSGLVVDAHVDRVARKFGIPISALADPAQDVAARATRERLPQETSESLRTLAAELERRYAELTRQVAALDPTLERPVDGALRRSLDALDRVSRKLERSVRRRHETELRQLLRARTALLPAGHRQERILTAASFLARHGPAVFDECAHAASGWYRHALEGRPVPA